MHVMIRGYWANCVGTDYCDYLGEFDSLEDVDAKGAAEDYAWDIYEPDEDVDDFDDEGPDYSLEEYDPKKHDGLKAGGGDFSEAIKRGY